MEKNGLEYEEIEKLMSIQLIKENCEYVSFIHGKLSKKRLYRI